MVFSCETFILVLRKARKKATVFAGILQKTQLTERRHTCSVTVFLALADDFGKKNGDWGEEKTLSQKCDFHSEVVIRNY